MLPPPPSSHPRKYRVILMFVCLSACLYKSLSIVISAFVSIYTKILEVNLFAFAYRLFHRDFSPINGTLLPLELSTTCDSRIHMNCIIYLSILTALTPYSRNAGPVCSGYPTLPTEGHTYIYNYALLSTNKDA